MKNLIFVALVVAMFTMGCNAFLIAGLLPQISHTLSQSIAITGQGMTAFSFFYFLSAPVFSILFSKKPFKQVIQIALLVFLLGNLLTLLSTSITLFLLGRSLAGIATGIFTPSCLTMAFHFADEANRGKRLSMIWGANSAGAVFGVPFGIYLSSLLNWQLSIACLIILSLLVFVIFSLQNVQIKLPVMPSLRERFYLLLDQKIMFVITITFFAATASLGLYSYMAVIQSGISHSLVLTIFSWGLGGFIGSSFVGFFIDLTKKPQMIMTFILVGLIVTFITIPFVMNLPYFGLIPFFMWGVFGWAMPTTQQHILFELQEKQGSILAALNGSAIGLGNAVGTAVGGAIIAAGFHGIELPFCAAILLIIVLIGQFVFLKKSEGVIIRE